MKNLFLFSYFGFEPLKSSYEIASLFHMHKDMGERIPGEQDTLSLITEGPSQGPSNSQKYTFLKKMYVYVSTVMKYAFADILVSRYPEFYVPPPPPPPDPRKNKNKSSYFGF